MQNDTIPRSIASETRLAVLFARYSDGSETEVAYNESPTCHAYEAVSTTKLELKNFLPLGKDIDNQSIETRPNAPLYSPI